MCNEQSGLKRLQTEAATYVGHPLIFSFVMLAITSTGLLTQQFLN